MSDNMTNRVFFIGITILSSINNPGARPEKSPVKGIYAEYAKFIAHRARGWLYSVDDLVSLIPSEFMLLKKSEASSYCVTVMVFDKLTI